VGFWSAIRAYELVIIAIKSYFEDEQQVAKSSKIEERDSAKYPIKSGYREERARGAVPNFEKEKIEWPSNYGANFVQCVRE